MVVYKITYKDDLGSHVHKIQSEEVISVWQIGSLVSRFESVHVKVKVEVLEPSYHGRYREMIL